MGPHFGAILGAWLYMLLVGAHTGDSVEDYEVANAGKSTLVSVKVS